MSQSLTNIESCSYLLFGSIAVHKGFLTRAQLSRVINIQKQKNTQRLGIILLECGYLSDSEVQEVLLEQKRFYDLPPHQWQSMPPTVLTGLAACRKSFSKLSANQILEAQHVYEKSLRTGQVKSFEEILTQELGAITLEDLNSLAASITVNLFDCPTCKRVYHLYNYDADKTVACPVCPSVALLPGKSCAVSKTRAFSTQQKSQVRKTTGFHKAPKTNNSMAQTQVKKDMNFYEVIGRKTPTKPGTGRDSIEAPKAGRNALEPPSLNMESLRQTQVRKDMNFQEIMGKKPGATRAFNKSSGNKKTARQLGKTSALSQIGSNKKTQTLDFKTKLQNIYNDIETNKDKNLSSIKPTTPKMSMPVKASVVFLVLTICVFVMYLTFSENSSPKKSSVLIAEYKAGQIPAEKMIAPKKLAPDPAQKYIREVCGKLFRKTPPNQETLNQLIKTLYLKRIQYPESGDLHNLLGRLFWYKVMLDKEGTFENSWKKKWREEAKNFWEIAKKSYQQEKYKPTIKLLIQEWMPEKKSDSERFIEYDGNKDAERDIYKLFAKDF